MLLAIAVLAVPDDLATTSALTMPDVGLPILVAGAIGGYSYATWYDAIRKIGVARAMTLNITYAMWGILFAWMIQQTSASPFAVAGCIVVVAGACLTMLSGRQQPGANPPGSAGVPGGRQSRRSRADLQRRPLRRPVDSHLPHDLRGAGAVKLQATSVSGVHS